VQKNHNNYRARKIIKVLLSSFETREGVFSDTKELLENQIPLSIQYKSKQHANFLFYLISQDHGTKSSKLYDRAKNLYVSYPENFEPKSILKNYASEESKNLVNFLKLMGVRYPINSARFWYRNSEMLFNQYDNDARNIFDSDDGLEILKNIKKFYGFGPKISGLLFRVFVGIGIAHPRNIEEIDFPTDIHDTRIAALTEIVDIPTGITEGNYAPFVKIAQNAWQKACRDEGINWLQIDRALWILGSKGCVNERHHDCPIKNHCIKGTQIDINQEESSFY